MMLNPEDYPALIQKRAEKTMQEVAAEAVRIKFVIVIFNFSSVQFRVWLYKGQTWGLFLFSIS